MMADEHGHHHEHEHDHAGDPEHSHPPEHQHGHGETHDLAHSHEHAHDHEHEHAHDHEHGHEHDHGHEHGHEHEHVQMSPEEYATALRAAKDAYMRDDPTSPLGKEERAGFAGLKYYPYDPAFAFQLPLDRDVSTETVQMGTSTGDSREYPRVGKVHFEVRGDPVELTIYGEPDNLFLPLRDATSGKATYGAGRYLEPDMVGHDTIFIDFNLLYNPFCAYNEQFSCPLPPVENWLSVPIEAGEQSYSSAEGEG
jgi:uncharacterized protein